ncbi:MAG TPA: SprT-like domain-containing protein [Longimicrobium sp.]
MKIEDLLLDLFGLQPPKAKPEPRARKPAPEPRAKAPEPTRPSGRSADEVLGIVRRAGAPWERVLFTSNRRIMASVANRGRDLRLNEAFAAAPREVLAALAELFSAKSARKRAQAKGTVRRFIAQIPPAPDAAPKPRPRRTAAGDRAQIARMQAEFDRVNLERFAGSLPRVPIHLSGRMKRRNGHFSPNPLEIVISRRLCTKGAPGEAEHTMRHEMIHLWQHVEGLPVDHGAAFRKMARRLDVHPRATRRVEWTEKE